MSDNPHAHLTGTDLHEPKGVETASVNQVYVADGVGSGAWGLISKSTLADTANPFGSQLFHIREEQTSGSTSAGDVSNRVWSIRTLNTVKTNEISGASLATNQFTLGAGT